MRVRAIMLALAATLAGPAPVSAQGEGQGQDGQLVFNNACRTCHSVDAGDNRLGPTLAGVVGRQAGSVEGYGYSSAMKNAGFAWDEAQLDKFLANPDTTVPGHNMKPFGGIADQAERAAIIAYLKERG